MKKSSQLPSVWGSFLSVLVAFLTVSAARAEPSEPIFVKITMGIGDTTERDWSGSVRVDTGAIVDLQPWAFEARHELDAEKRSWVCDSAVRVARGQTRFAEPRRGVVLGVRGPSSTRLTVDTSQGTFLCEPNELRLGKLTLALKGAVSMARAMTPLPAADTEGEEDHPAIAVDAAGRVWVAYISWEQGADVVYARSFDGRAWSEPLALAGPGDFYQVQLAKDGQGKFWAVWAAQEEGNWDLYARLHHAGKWGQVVRLTEAPGSDFMHDLATDAAGHVWMAWQSFRNGNADIYLKNLSDPKGRELDVTDHAANDWEPSVACDVLGNVFVAWDTYRNGNYDVYLRRMAPGPGKPIAVAASPDFEAHPSVACDREGRVWVAYDSAQPNWGKDYTRDETLCDGNFTATLHAYRRLELRCITPGGVHAAPVPIPQSMPDSWRKVPTVVYGTVGHRRSYDLPHLTTDAHGNLWLTYRLNRQGYLGHPPGGGVWEIETIWFDGKQWSDPVFIPQSHGRNNQRVGTALDNQGSLWFAWPTGSHFQQDDCDIYVGHLPSAEREKLLKPGPPVDIPAPIERNPEASVAHRWEVDGKAYQVYWGDLHRHTDLSLCTPTIDGTLFDAYRYALDAAKLDFLGATDHTRDVPPYPWWCSQKMADLFTVQDRFAGFYSYERSNNMGKGGGGHRNIWFPKRGHPVYSSNIVDKNAPSPAGLYEVLRDGNVRCAMAAHTPGWNQSAGEGTWTYSDSEFEPVAEIFQAYRTSYEMPKQAGDRTSGGYKRSIWAALERGYRLGLIASSDHWSTHLSYACVYADDLTRESIFRAIQQRRTYAAMDKIVLEFSVNHHVMGEEFTTSGPVDVRAKVIGTEKLSSVELVKDNRFIYTAQPEDREFGFTFRDEAATAGTSYYYLRVSQENKLPDGSPIMAWSSPVWVTIDRPAKK